MIESQHTVVASVAMSGPRRPKDLAGLAVFQFVHGRAFSSKRPIVNLVLLVLSKLSEESDTSALLYLAGRVCESHLAAGMMPGSVKKVTR